MHPEARMGERAESSRIPDLSTSDRPRERLAAVGPEALSNAELVAILLRSGIVGLNAVELARRLLAEAGGLTGLHRMSYEELRRKRGVGQAKGAQRKGAH